MSDDDVTTMHFDLELDFNNSWLDEHVPKGWDAEQRQSWITRWVERAIEGWSADEVMATATETGADDND